MEPVIVIGAGLAGSEAAWQLAQRGIPVELHEMKPEKMSPAHHTPYFGELVCSNSLRSDQIENAVGLLKEELRRCGSLIMECADTHRVEAGGALAVDRNAIAQPRRADDGRPARKAGACERVSSALVVFFDDSVRVNHK